MKKNVRLVFLCLGLVLFTTVNYWCVASDSFDIASKLFLANIEGLASQEAELPKQSTQSHDCTIVRLVIDKIVIDKDGNETVTMKEQAFPGKQGDCTGPSGPCNLWRCTEKGSSN